ncbi:MAG TPA: DHH family phosphoesterase [Candidatus Diapherotrites archaeon]|uniref:DHH family phosphoesterase n=1 Tax=Candidatus Iainarchaeum sp. TaxID=3101447 RepID=A0A7J4IWN3_9ARCH|nr:DHH family phosphoesterase [Candidatus Diapherotrites archaeon]
MEWKSKLSGLARRIKALDDFVVVHHYDADGCSAGAIMCKALQRAGKRVGRKWVKQLYRETIAQIRGMGTNFVFVDFGSGQLAYLKEEFGERLFVFDHHQKTDVVHENQFSPFDYGINGGTEISASGIAFLFALEMDRKNIDLAPLALVGAVGDVQDFSGKLIGLNSQIVEMGSKSGYVKVENGLRLYGRVTRPLVQFLMYSTSPMLPELTANEGNCVKFYRELGIELKKGEQWRNYNDLSLDERKALSTALILRLNSFNVPEWKIQELFGEVYTFPHENQKSPCSEAKEFSTLCNACGRHGMADVAIEVCMGDREEKYFEALDLMAEHRRQLRQGIEHVTKNGVMEEEHYYWFDAGQEIKESIVGIVAGMLYGSALIETNKPIIAIARNEDGTLKISGRATKELLEKGINLGMAFREVCADIGDGSEGGGHSVAAGLKLNADKIEVFRQKLNEKIAEQIAKRNGIRGH